MVEAADLDAVARSLHAFPPPAWGAPQRINSKLAAAGHDASLIRQVHEAANHTAFLTAAVIGLIALLVAALLMPREKAGRSTHQPVDSSEADPTRSSSRSGDPFIAKEESA